MSLLKKDLDRMYDAELNRFFLIKNTDYNRSVKYVQHTKNLWRKLYNNGNGFWIISRIADLYQADYKTVKMAVDKNYLDKVNAARVESDRKYRTTHKIKCKSGYKNDLARYKRHIIFSDTTAHLKAI